MKGRVTPIFIKKLSFGEIFVFGSNLSGFHGAGAAKKALEFGAIYGQATGLQGMTYAIPTKSEYIRRTLSLEEIKPYVDDFIDYAEKTPEYTFLVTEIGCGLAGLKPNQVAPLFKNAINVNNINLPDSFWQVLT